MAFDFGRSFDRNRQLLLACTFAFSIAWAVVKSQGLVPNCKSKDYGWRQLHVTPNSEANRNNVWQQRLSQIGFIVHYAYASRRS